MFHGCRCHRIREDLHSTCRTTSTSQIKHQILWCTDSAQTPRRSRMRSHCISLRSYSRPAPAAAGQSLVLCMALPLNMLTCTAQFRTVGPAPDHGERAGHWGAASKFNHDTLAVAAAAPRFSHIYAVLADVYMCSAHGCARFVFAGVLAPFMKRSPWNTDSMNRVT